MKFGVLQFPGSNCDYDCLHVTRDVLGQPSELIWHESTDLKGSDCIIVPGGFSYGDYLRSGAMAKLSPVISAVKKFADEGGLVLGICNGFQILTESGLLPGVLMRNRDLRFLCEDVYIRVESNKNPFTSELRPGQVIQAPIAHFDGNYYVDDPTLQELEKNGQVLFRYSDKEGKVSDATNPNGSLNNIAGISNKAGNVVGLMPHPERSSEGLLGSVSGKILFESVIRSWLNKKKV